jgi:hypothetical protein
VAAQEEQRPGEQGGTPLLTAGSLQFAAQREPRQDDGSAARATDRDRQERRHLPHGVPDSEKCAAPEQVDRRESRDELRA